MSNLTTKPACHSILLIEDDKGIQNSLKLALEIEGYNVYTADNGKEGLDLLQKIPPVCLILLDLMMPVMNGVEFLEEIGKDLILSNIPVVFVTAYGESAKKLPSKSVIEKPVDLNILLEAVKEWCGNPCSL